MASNDSSPMLPTLGRLRATVPETASATAIAQEWLSAFSYHAAKQDTAAIKGLFLGDAYWRDLLALTSDIRTLHGWENIQVLLDARLSHILAAQLLQEPHNLPAINTIFPDLTLLQFSFRFDTPFGEGTGICRLAPGEDNKWRVYTMFTCLDSLKNNVEKVGSNRVTSPCIEPWEAVRKRQVDFTDRDPDVIIIGGGQAGLDVAARLKHLDVSTLVLERHSRIGDNWRNRYDSLCLHDTVWYDHLPYMPFPSSWPVYCSAGKLANFLEAYAETMELSVWTSSEITVASWNNDEKNWKVIVARGSEAPRTMTVKHLIFTTGGGVANKPKVPNEDKFKGKIYHSSEFKSALEFSGKKAVVVGACNSGHDIAQDFHRHGVDVTIHQRSSTYVISAKVIADIVLGGLYHEGTVTDYADRVNASLPFAVIKLFHQRLAPYFAQNFDKDILEGLNKVGFKTNSGPDDAGIIPLLYTRRGGYYIDTGGSQDIIDGRIKIKSGTAIQEFTEHGLMFEDGSVLDADVVVFATGYGDAGDAIKGVCGTEVTAQLDPIWGQDEEGEIQSVWRGSGHENLWIGMGNLSMCRFYSGILALQIKSSLDGILPPKLPANLDVIVASRL